MKKALLYSARTLTVLAAVVGLALALLETTTLTVFTCFDSCPSSGSFFTRLASSTALVLTPPAALEALALAAFVAYCALTRQMRRAIIALVVALVGALVGVAMLAALMRQGQATLPLFPGEDILVEGPVERWISEWGVAQAGALLIWTGFLTVLLWRAE